MLRIIHNLAKRLVESGAEKKNTLFPHPGPPRNRPAGDDSLVGAVEVADAEGGLGAVPE